MLEVSIQSASALSPFCGHYSYCFLLESANASVALSAFVVEISTGTKHFNICLCLWMCEEFILRKNVYPYKFGFENLLIRINFFLASTRTCSCSCSCSRTRSCTWTCTNSRTLYMFLFMFVLVFMLVRHWVCIYVYVHVHVRIRVRIRVGVC